MFIDLPPSNPLYQQLKQQVDRCGGTTCTVQRIQQISNPALDRLYEAQRTMVERETGAAGLNERWNLKFTGLPILFKLTQQFG